MHNPKYSVSSGGGVTTPTTPSMRRTLSWCYPAFRQIRPVIVVDVYAIALERPPAGASILSKTAKLRFYRRPRLSPGSWKLEGQSPTQSKKRLWGISELAPLLKPRDESFLENAQKAKRSGKLCRSKPVKPQVVGCELGTRIPARHCYFRSRTNHDL